MSKKIYLILILVVAVAAVLGFYKYGGNGVENSGPEAGVPVTGDNSVPQAIETATITYTANGFSPNKITVKQGTKVTFVNSSPESFWPASAKHPTHTVYPESDIKKCGTSEADSIFDACSGIPPGGGWSFVFNSPGTWNYHDHLNASRFGSIVVE